MKKKVGFVIDYFDFRNDIRKVINLISQKYRLVLFCKKENEEQLKIYVDPSIEIRTIDEYKKSILNIIWDYLFILFARIPKSRKNFYLTELFRLSNVKNKRIHNKGRIILELKMLLPDFLKYDTYLKNISPKTSTPIEDIDKFLFFTDIYDHYFLSRVIRSKKFLSVYVYSWDHPCKFLRFSNQVKYLVWHNGIKEDLQNLQYIDVDNIRVTGSSQLAFVHQFLQLDKATLINTYTFKYVYFACSVAAPKLVAEEVRVIKMLSDALLKVNADVKLVIRPYPILRNWQYYEPLKILPNILFDDQYRGKDLSVSEQSIFEKYIKIHFAEGFFHLGTTLGLETCFLETPSFIIDLDEFKSRKGNLNIYHFVHQYQNEKYLLLQGYSNIIKNSDGLLLTLKDLLKNKATHLDYNRAVTKNMQLYSFDDFANSLINY